MPSRRRTKSQPSALTPAPPADPAERFAAALRESERRDRAAREKAARDKAEAEQRAAAAAARDAALAAARRDLERAIGAVRAAKAAGRSTATADAVWRQAKSALIELETGAAPAWAPKAEPESVG